MPFIVWRVGQWAVIMAAATHFREICQKKSLQQQLPENKTFISYFLRGVAGPPAVLIKKNSGNVFFVGPRNIVTNHLMILFSLNDEKVFLSFGSQEEAIIDCKTCLK